MIENKANPLVIPEKTSPETLASENELETLFNSIPSLDSSAIQNKNSEYVRTVRTVHKHRTDIVLDYVQWESAVRFARLSDLPSLSAMVSDALTEFMLAHRDRLKVENFTLNVVKPLEKQKPKENTRLLETDYRFTTEQLGKLTKRYYELDQETEKGNIRHRIQKPYLRMLKLEAKLEAVLPFEEMRALRRECGKVAFQCTDILEEESSNV